MGEKAKFGEQTQFAKGGGKVPEKKEQTREERIKYLKKRMAIGGGGTIAALLVAVYFFFGVFFPAYKEYKFLTQEQIALSERLVLDMPIAAVPDELKEKWATSNDLLEKLGWNEFYDENKWQEGCDANGRCTKFIAPQIHSPRLAENLKLKGELTLTKRAADGTVLANYGPYRNTIVDVGESALVDTFQGLFTLSDFRYLGFGLSLAANEEAFTGCQTELNTQYTNDARVTGAQGENATNIYEVSGVLTADESATIEEFCVFNQGPTGGGTMWSRVLTGTITLTTSNTLTATYRLTVE